MPRAATAASSRQPADSSRQQWVWHCNAELKGLTQAAGWRFCSIIGAGAEAAGGGAGEPVCPAVGSKGRAAEAAPLTDAARLLGEMQARCRGGGTACGRSSQGEPVVSSGEQQGQQQQKRGVPVPQVSRAGHGGLAS